MKASELRDLSVDELRTREADLRRQLFDIKVKHNTGVLESTTDLGKVKRDIARVLSVRSELESKIKPKGSK